jgi:hypothetical protein
MIGDTLFDCGESLDRYLADYEWPEEVEARVRQLREEIRKVQRWIDAGPSELVGYVRLRNARPSFIKWMEQAGLGRAERSGGSWIVRSDDRDRKK